MKFGFIEINAALVAQVVDALRDPAFARSVAVIGAIGVIGWIVTTYLKASGGS